MTRLQREEWRSIDRLPSYEFSSLGRVRRRERGGSPRSPVGKLIKSHPARSGYLVAGLTDALGNRKTYNLHRLICEAFHGAAPSEKHHAAHGDGNRHNNVAENLRWATPKENGADKIKHGTTNRGDRCPQAKLDWQTVSHIREKFTGTLGQVTALAQTYGVADSTIGRIVHGQAWRRPGE